MRIAEVQVGSIRFKERFLVGGVTCPLLSLGKLYKAGFYVIPEGSQPESFVLTNGSVSEPVRLKRQSLCTTGRIRVLTSGDGGPPAIRALEHVTLIDPLLKLDASGWQRMASRCYALLSFEPRFVDTTLVPLSELLWFRTTLVRRGGVWSLVEYAEDVSNIRDRTCPFEQPGVEQVITIAHSDRTMSPEQLGFMTPDREAPPGAGAAAASGSQEHHESPAEDHAAPVAPPADGRGEASPEAREAVESVTVNGVTVNRDSSLRVMRAALFTLGLGKNGSKSQCWDRLVRHLREADLLREHQVRRTLSAETIRPPNAPPIAQVPSTQDVEQHVLTHEPYQAWCETCVQFRARQNQHASEAAHDPGSRSVVSFDFGYCSRLKGDRAREDKDRLTVLFLHDRHTKAVYAVPTAQKGGPSLSHLITESARFIIWLGHRSVRLRCDNEPSIMAVQNGLMRTLRNLGVDASKDNSPIESHQSNGPAEQVVGWVRQHAAVFIHDLEKACGASSDQVLFSPQHPLYGWAVCHACWVRNRYTPAHGTTPYEAITDSPYAGTVCRFGEKVLGYIKPDGKASARWRHGVWLGKATGSDTHILGMTGGVFVTRSVRRFSDSFDADLAASFDVCVWEHGLSSIGGKLVLSRKKPAPPTAMPVPAYTGLPEFAAEKGPVIPRSPSQVAGSDVLTPPGSGLSMSLPASSASPPSVTGASDMSVGLNDETPVEAGTPAPLEAAPVHVEDLGLSENPRPLKAARGDGPGLHEHADATSATSPEPEGQLSLLSAEGIQLCQEPSSDAIILSGEETPCVAHVMQVSYEHEDESPALAFDGDTLESLEDYDEGFLEDQPVEAELLSELCLPRTSDLEPDLPSERLQALDELADSVEIERLKGMSVLMPEEAIYNKEYEGQEATKLTTRMVRSWREKEVNSKPVWYRRSRYVAREYAWLSVRHDLFSPASTAVSNRLLPIHFLCHEPDPDDPWIMVAIDIGDAYLSVPQTRLVVVTHAGVNYVLGRVLPGQRDGSKEWYLAFSSFLGETLGFEKCAALPSLIREPVSKFSMQMHVDDLLGAGSKKFLVEKLEPALKSKYRVTLHILEHPGDCISFLKRKHTLMSDGRMLLTPSSKHFEKLFALLKVDERSAPKKTPYASVLDEGDTSEPLGPAEAKAFRCAIGVLLYLAVDLVECQGAIRALSSFMTTPTRNALIALRHLVKYLLTGQHHGLMLDRKNRHSGLSGEVHCTDSTMSVESYSDSDWASHKGHRRSTSSSMVFVAGCLLYSSSRTQRVIALSSGEAELLSATSSLCDALFIRQLVAFLTECPPAPVHHFVDASAAKSILERSGVGRVRHLSVRVLWTQQLVSEKIVLLHKVSTHLNVADLNTKSLSKQRMFMLLNRIGCWDTALEEPVGEDVIAACIEQQTTRDAIRAVKASGSVNKQVVRGIVLAVVSALGRAADEVEVEDEFSSDYELPLWVTRVLVWVLSLWAPDEHGVSIAGLISDNAWIPCAFCVIMLGLYMCCRGSQNVPSQRVQVCVHDQGNAGVSLQIGQAGAPGSVHVDVGEPAPGTPGYPRSRYSDEGGVPIDVALKRGARSKSTARPSPRHDQAEQGARGSNQERHVPRDDRSESTESETLHEMLGMPIAQARRRTHPPNSVFTSQSGRCYHLLRCYKLDACDRVMARDRATLSAAYRPCKKCNP